MRRLQTEEKRGEARNPLARGGFQKGHGVLRWWAQQPQAEGFENQQVLFLGPNRKRISLYPRLEEGSLSLGLMKMEFLPGIAGQRSSEESLRLQACLPN